MFSGYLAPVSGETEPAQKTLQPVDRMEDPENNVTEGHGRGTASAVRAEEKEAPASSAPAVSVPPEKTEASQPASSAPEQPEKAETSAAEAAAEPVIYTVSAEFLRPVNSAEILAPYTDIPVYSETMRDYRAHLGADYIAERGETVKAAANGIVKKAYTDMLLGNTLGIEHGGVELYFCGLGETFLVKPGEIVFAGQDIGCITAAPYESAMEPHLHLEAIRNGEMIDPEKLF